MKNLLQLILVSVLLGGCGDEPTHSEDRDSTTTTTEEKQDFDACVVLKFSIESSYKDASDLQKARDLVAEAVGDEMQQYLPDDCSYRFTSQGTIYDVYVDLWKIHSKYADDEAFNKKIKYLNTDKTETISGIGEKAVYAPNRISIVAFNNRSIIQVNAACAGEFLCKKGKPVAIALTKSILEELEK